MEFVNQKLFSLMTTRKKVKPCTTVDNWRSRFSFLDSNTSFKMTEKKANKWRRTSNPHAWIFESKLAKNRRENESRAELVSKERHNRRQVLQGKEGYFESRLKLHGSQEIGIITPMLTRIKKMTMQCDRQTDGRPNKHDRPKMPLCVYSKYAKTH